jgi:hypothetical protein
VACRQLFGHVAGSQLPLSAVRFEPVASGHLCRRKMRPDRSRSVSHRRILKPGASELLPHRLRRHSRADSDHARGRHSNHRRPDRQAGHRGACRRPFSAERREPCAGSANHESLEITRPAPGACRAVSQRSLLPRHAGRWSADHPSSPTDGSGWDHQHRSDAVEGGPVLALQTAQQDFNSA